MNTSHCLAISIGLVQLFIVLVYYIPLFFVDYTGQSNFVSDLLFSDSTYRSLMTFFVALQLAVCALFVVQWHSFVGAQLFFLFVAWIGWVVLTTYYREVDGVIGNVHYAGVGIFIFGSVVYYSLMLWSMAYRFQRITCFVCSEMLGLVLVFAAAIVSGVYFIVGVMYYNDSLSWVYEHAALVLFISGHVFLFTVDARMEEEQGPPPDERAQFFKDVRLDRQENNDAKRNIDVKSGRTEQRNVTDISKKDDITIEPINNGMDKEDDLKRTADVDPIRNPRVYNNIQPKNEEFRYDPSQSSSSRKDQPFKNDSAATNQNFKYEPAPNQSYRYDSTLNQPPSFRNDATTSQSFRNNPASNQLFRNDPASSQSSSSYRNDPASSQSSSSYRNDPASSQSSSYRTDPFNPPIDPRKEEIYQDCMPCGNDSNGVPLFRYCKLYKQK
jgi:hypothetical protein